MNQNILELIKKLRTETGISMGLCNEAAKESDGNFENAMTILRKKCCEVGKKFYKNIERPMGHFLCFYKESDNIFRCIKFGVESEFLATSQDLDKFAKMLLAKNDFIRYIEDNKEILENELLFLCGILKENIQIVYYEEIVKDNSHYFLIQKKGSTPNENVFTGLNIIVATNSLEEENRKNLFINVNSISNKKINNIISEKNKELKYFYKFTNDIINELINSPSVNNREIKVKDFLENQEIIKILSF
jgi:translation elongation factor EF-Ts